MHPCHQPASQGSYLTSPLARASSDIILRAVKASSLTKLQVGEGRAEDLVILGLERLG